MSIKQLVPERLSMDIFPSSVAYDDVYLLNDVIIIPRIACHWYCAVATTMKPVADIKTANVIRTLKR